MRSKCEYDIGFNIIFNSCDVNLKAYNTQGVKSKSIDILKMPISLNQKD